MKTFSSKLVVVAKEEALSSEQESLMDLANSWNATLASFSQFAEANYINIVLPSVDLDKNIRQAG